jgi:hypothetical protein
MSPHDPPAVAVDAHDTEHAHDEDDVSGEPRTPLWLPLVGGVLFLGALMFIVATRPPGKTAEELSKEAETAAQERAGTQNAAAAAPAPAPAPPQMPMQPQPGGCGQPQPGAQPGGCGQPQPGGCGG